MNPQQREGGAPAPVPEDARETTPEQRAREDRLEHQDGDPYAPAQQSTGDIADESTR
jgi:hypothetical protein